MAQDHYQTMGVSRTASPEEIKAAFRKLAAQHHPDKNPNDPSAAERFKEINQAYQTLGDPKRRAMYDRFGHQAESPGSPFGAGGPFAGGVVDIQDLNIDGVLGDLLGVFGVGRGDRGDIKREIGLSFEEAAFGCEKEFTYERTSSCEGCRGTGAAPGTTPETCGACQGRGRVRLTQGFIPISIDKTCAECKGRGAHVRTPCKDCKGSGLTQRAHTLRVTFPAGVDQGATKLVPGAGNRPRPSLPPGDLELIVTIAQHPFFRRQGDDVLCRAPFTFVQAALGGEIDVPTLDGKGKLKIPPGTQPFAVLRIRGRGIPRGPGLGRGDQLVEMVLEVPTRVNERQRALLEELGKEFGEEVLPQHRSFFDKLKGLIE